MNILDFKNPATLMRAMSVAPKPTVNPTSTISYGLRSEKELGEELDKYLNVSGEALPPYGNSKNKLKVCTPRETGEYFNKRFSDLAHSL